MGTGPDETAGVELRVDEERFRTILEHAPVMIDAFDDSGVCVIWNRECVRRLGWTQEELRALEDPLAVFYPDPAVLREVHEDVARADGQFREYEVLAKDGSTRTQLWANFRLPTTGTVIAVGHDVTEQRAVEAQLLQSQKMEAVGQLTGGIAHDFNNLLTVILASTDLLLRDAEPGTAAHDLVRCIRQAAQDGSELVRHLGSFSRQRRLTVVAVDLARLVDDLAPTLRRLLPESIDVRVDHASRPLAVLADRTALEQIVVNLATNARDAIAAHGTIEISTRREPPDRVVLALRDSGHGMPPAVLERVFEPFFTTKPPGKGTGLGLPTVYGLVQQHGGTISLRSAPGEGTTVEVSLPALEPDDAAAHEPGEEPEPARGDELVLIVEDDASTRATAKGALEHLGYRVLTAVDGADALAILESTPDVALVLSDVVMPRLTGPELLARLRASGRHVPAFAFWTGYTSRETARSLDPSVPLLEKPWSLASLATFVRRSIDASAR